jgi:hypothetical protein
VGEGKGEGEGAGERPCVDAPVVGGGERNGVLEPDEREGGGEERDEREVAPL